MKVTKSHLEGRTERVRRISWGSIVAGGLAILACELPIILAALGFAGLSAGAKALRLPVLIEITAIIIGLIGVLTLIAFAAVKVVKRQEEAK